MEPALLALPTARLITWTWHPDEGRLVVPAQAAEALGPALAAALDQPHWGFVHPGDTPLLEQALDRCVQDGVPIEQAVRVHPDVGSSVRWLEVHATCSETATGPALQGVLLDGTRRHLAEVARERHEARYRLIMDSAREYAILTMDRDGRITGWSVGATRLFGYSEQEALGLPAASLFNDDDAAAGVPAREIAHALVVGRVKDERWHRRKDGTRFFGSGLLMRMEGDDESSRLLKILRDRTFEEQARTALAESQERLRLATDAAGLGVFEWNTEMRQALWENERMYEIFGHSPDRGPLDAESAAARIVDEDLEVVRTAMHRHAASGEPLHLTMRVRPGAGRPPRHVEVWGRFRPDEHGRRTRLIGVMADVTAAREREQALRESESRFRLATEAVNGLIYDVDMRTGLTWRSDSLERLIGVAASTAPRTIEWWVDRMHPDDREWARAQYAEAASGKRQRYSVEYRIRHRDGHYLQIWDQGLVERDADGVPLRMLGCSVDVTRQRATEAALLEADRRKDAFLATLAHELRNPLAPIRHGLEILRRADQSAASAERARELMTRQVSQMVRLIDDLLDLSRITLGKISLRRQVVAFDDVLRSARETCLPVFRAAGQHLQIEAATEPLHVVGDLMRLAQVVTNLLNNASKFSDPGATVYLRVRASATEVTCEVQDDGAGIAADELPVIFEMFAQGNERMQQVRGGLGVGLALVKQLVDMHGGRVRAESAGPGRGSTFTITLPRVSPPAEQPEPARWPEVATTMKRVLVVDDNTDSAESLSMLLELMGHTVRTAHDGEQALVEADAFRPDLVLMDIGMPRMDGYEAARRLRQAPWAAETVLVALTGWGQDEDKRRSEAAGFNHHLIKPVDPAALEALLNQPTP